MDADKFNRASQYVVGLAIALLLPLFSILIVHNSYVRPFWHEPTATLIGLLFMWMATFLLLAHIVFAENEPLESIGWHPLTVKQWLAALGIGVLCSLLVPALYFAMSLVIALPNGGDVLTQTEHPSWVILAGIFTAAVTEEILLRAYPIERFAAIFENQWIGVCISLLVFVSLHAENWSMPHVLGVVLPLGIILSLLYLKTRSVLFVIIVHFMVDLPLWVMSIS